MFSVSESARCSYFKSWRKWNGEIKEEFKAKGLAEAREKLKEINMPEEERRAYKYYLEQLSYEASIAATIKFEEEFAKRVAREEGREEGKIEGRQEGKIEMARELKKKGIDINIISETSGLSCWKRTVAFHGYRYA